MLANRQREFWSVVLKNIKELPDIVEAYVEAGLAKRETVSVTGLSMGGITTCIALTQYPWIHSRTLLDGQSGSDRVVPLGSCSPAGRKVCLRSMTTKVNALMAPLKT